MRQSRECQIGQSLGMVRGIVFVCAFYFENDLVIYDQIGPVPGFEDERFISDREDDFALTGESGLLDFIA